MKSRRRTYYPEVKTTPMIVANCHTALRAVVMSGVISGHFAVQIAMSALPPKADTCGAATNVRFGPIADIHQSANRPATPFEINRPPTEAASINHGFAQTRTI
jgi:hypothetical protein